MTDENYRPDPKPDFEPYDSNAKLKQELARIEQQAVAAIEAAAERERAARTEATRRDIQRRAQRMVDDFVKGEVARAGIPDLKVSRVLVMLKKPKEYYNAYAEAVALMLHDDYLLDRPVAELKADVLLEASKRAACVPVLSDSCWYAEFSPTVQKRVNSLLAGLKIKGHPTSCEASIGCIGGSSGLSLGDWKSPNTHSSRNPAG